MVRHNKITRLSQLSIPAWCWPKRIVALETISAIYTVRLDRAVKQCGMLLLLPGLRYRSRRVHYLWISY